MTLKIERAAEDRVVVFTMSGRIQMEHLAELRRLLDLETHDLALVLDMKDVKLVDRDAVKFLARCQLAGVRLQNCPAYIEEWIQRETGSE